MSENKIGEDFLDTLPWRIASRKHSEGFYVIHGKDESRELQILKIHTGPHPIKEHLDRQEDNAEAIVSAVNNTYGSGVNPIAVPDLLEALKFIREDPQFKRMDWKLKVTIDAAIAKAKLI